jgi:hypothetical protein
LRQHISSGAANRTYRRTSFSLLRERIHYTRRELDTVSRVFLKLYLLVVHTLSAEDWDLISRITSQHCRNFLLLHKVQHPPGPPDSSRIVINLSGVLLKEAACSAQSKGWNTPWPTGVSWSRISSEECKNNRGLA